MGGAAKPCAPGARTLAALVRSARGSRAYLALAREGSVEERRIERWMTEEVLTLPLDAKIVDALELMEGERIRHVPIVDRRGRLVGIVSDRDVKRSLPDRDVPASVYSRSLAT